MIYLGDKKIVNPFFNVPLKEIYNGSVLVWRKSSGIWEDGHEGVDLDLPSGLIWATQACNPYVKFDLSESAYLTANGLDYISPAPLWGGRWRVPTAEEFYELINNTTMEIVNVHDVYYTLFRSANGRGVLLRHYGYINSNFGVPNPVDPYEGYYWSSTEKDANDAYRLYLSIRNTTLNEVGSGDKNLYRSIQLVFNPKD